MNPTACISLKTSLNCFVSAKGVDPNVPCRRGLSKALSASLARHHFQLINLISVNERSRTHWWKAKWLIKLVDARLRNIFHCTIKRAEKTFLFLSGARKAVAFNFRLMRVNGSVFITDTRRQCRWRLGWLEMRLE